MPKSRAYPTAFAPAAALLTLIAPRSCLVPLAAAAAIVALSALGAPPASAQSAARGAFDAALSAGYRFTEQSGEALYRNSCQACHMPDAKGATGAGTYPALAGDKNLAAGGYAVAVVVNGQRGMPPVGLLMSNDQVAAVVNYVRSHFGNNYPDAVTADDVKSIRQ